MLHVFKYAIKKKKVTYLYVQVLSIGRWFHSKSISDLHLFSIQWWKKEERVRRVSPNLRQFLLFDIWFSRYFCQPMRFEQRLIILSGGKYQDGFSKQVSKFKWQIYVRNFLRNIHLLRIKDTRKCVVFLLCETNFSLIL